MKFGCPKCGQHIDAENDWAGMEVNCPTCGGAIVIPTLKEAETLLTPPPPILESTQAGETQEGKRSSGASEYKYWAFISYSSKDKSWGSWLHGAIETYGVPAELVKRHTIPTGHPAPKRFHPIFRDRDELPASADLGGVIKDAICGSHYLIVICSPNAAKSRWVNKEIESFLALGRRDHILAIIVDGDPNAGDARECFPPALREFEPIAADARPQGDGKTNAKLKLLAGMLGVNFDALKQRDRQRRHRRLVRIAVTTGSLSALAATLIGVAVYQGRLAEQRLEASEIAVQKVEAAKQKADEAGQVAGEAREKAYEATQIVRDEKGKGLLSLYAADMVKIQNAWDQLDMQRVVGLLDGLRPEHNGGVDLRGFEWFYWWNQSHAAVAESVPIKLSDGKIAISPDGKHLVQSRLDKVEILDLTSGQLLLTNQLRKGGDGVTSICYSPDGKLIATAGDDRTVRVWDATSWRERLVLKGHRTSVNCISFSPDGSRIASASMFDYEAKVWDATSGQELLMLKGERHRSYIDIVCFSPDGKRIATGGDHELKLWDAASGKELLNLAGGAKSICFRPDGKRLVAAGRDMGAGTVFDAHSGQKLFALKGVGGNVCYSPDGTRMASGRHLWEAASGQELLKLKGDGEIIHFSPDGKRLISARPYGPVQVWDAATVPASVEKGKPVANASAWDRTTGSRDSAATLRFSPDGKRLASIGTIRKSDGEYVRAALKIWDTENGKELITLEGHGDDLYSVRFSPDGSRIATVGEDNGKDSVKVWDVATGRELLAIEEMTLVEVTLNGRIISRDILCFSPDGMRLAVVCEDDTVKVWDVTDSQKRITLKGHKLSVSCVYFSPDGKCLATVDDDDAVKVWDAASGIESFSLEGVDDGFTSVCFSPDGRRIATGCWDATVSVWDSANGKKLATLKGISEDAYIYGVCFSPDGTRVAACSDDDAKGLRQMMTVWDAATSRKLLALKGGGGVSVRFSPDGKRLVSGMTVWDAISGKELLSLQAEGGIVSFNSDGERRASSMEARDEKSIRKLLAFKGVSMVCLSPDGKRLAGLSGQTLKVWDSEQVAAEN